MAGIITIEVWCVILAFFLPYIAVMWKLLRIHTQTEISNKLKLQREIAYDGVAYSEERLQYLRKLRHSREQVEMPGKQDEAIKFMRTTGQFDDVSDDDMKLIIDSMLGKLENVGASGNRRV